MVPRFLRLGLGGKSFLGVVLRSERLMGFLGLPLFAYRCFGAGVRSWLDGWWDFLEI